MHVSTEKKISTANKPCIEDQTYSFFKCTESYFSKQRGCQYPWNVYKDLDIRVCTNYSEIYSVPYTFDKDKGFTRETFSESERLLRTRNKCPPPCFLNKYSLKFQSWRGDPDNNETSLQIVFEDFITVHKEEYLSCDMTCIVGEVGGNLGFFLGGSILLGFDIVFGWITKIFESVYRKMDHRIFS